jgi:hypothetical protein
MNTGIDVSEGVAVHAIRWLVEREYLVPFTVAVRDPDRHGLPTLAEPWLSAVLNGRMLDAVDQHGPPDPLDEHYIKRLEATESEAYFATAAFWDWWQSFSPDIKNAAFTSTVESVDGERAEPQVAPFKKGDDWWATEPPDAEDWHGPVQGTQKEIIEALRQSIEPNVTRKTLSHYHPMTIYVLRHGRGQKWNCYFRTQADYAKVNVELIRIRESKPSKKGQ